MGKKPELRSESVEQLIARFTDIALRQEEALLDVKTALFNRLYGEMDKVVEELRSRGPAELGKLTSLFAHPTGQVRYKAAVYSLGIHPIEARQVLEDLAKSNDFPSTLYARGTLLAYDSGRFKPK